jgi:hypothetical protein
VLNVTALYYLVYFSFIVQALLLPKEHYSTRNGLVFCLLYRVIPALTIQFVVGRYLALALNTRSTHTHMRMHVPHRTHSRD